MAGFTVTLDAAHKLDVLSVTFDAFRRLEGPPAQLQVRCSFDGGAFQDYGSVQDMGPTSVWTRFEIQSPLVNITNSITVRIYGYACSDPNRSLRIDNVTLNGTVTSTGLLPPSIGSMSLSDIQAALVGFNSATSSQYTLQYRDDLLSGVWADVTGQINVDGTGLLLVLSDASASGVPIRFYRVKAAPAP